jgi:hypothetical protein
MMESKGVKYSADGNKCAKFLPLGESLGGLFIRVVRGFGNNVRTPPLTTPFIHSV